MNKSILVISMLGLLGCYYEPLHIIKGNAEVLVLEKELIATEVETIAGMGYRIISPGEICYGDTLVHVKGHKRPAIIGKWSNEKFCVLQLKDSAYNYLEYNEEWKFWHFISERKAIKVHGLVPSELQFESIATLEDKVKTSLDRISDSIDLFDCEEFVE